MEEVRDSYTERFIWLDLRGISVISSIRTTESGVGIIASSGGIVTISFLGPLGLVVDLIITLIFFLFPKTTKTLLLYCPSTRRLNSEIVRPYLRSLEAFSCFKS